MIFLSNLVNGISLGSIYAIIALGYTMVYGIAKMLNFAHGDVIMVGAYITFCATQYWNLPPAVSILVAMLVCITTMTRMVNEERTQIGTMKAMGYSAGAVMAKYLLYTGLSALLGCLFGFFLGSTGLPYLVWYAYNIVYRYSALRFRYSPWMLTGCLTVAVAGSLLATWFAGRSALEEKPAELIRPKAPAAGKRVLLERIPGLWARLPFLSKVSLRNAFRYPSRVLMMILGISGCTALMVAGPYLPLGVPLA